MSAPVIWNGKNAKLLNSGGLLDATSQPFPRTGVKNYVEAWASNASGWTASGSGITVATDTTASDLPRANTTQTGIKFTGVSGSTAYAYVRFTLDAADFNVKQQLQFALNGTLGSNASGNFRVDVYSNMASNYGGTYTRLPLSTDSSSVSSLPALEGTYRTTFDAPGSAQQWIEVRIGLNAAVTTSIVISDLVVGPGTQVQGAAVTGWQSYTPTLTGVGTPTSLNALYRRVGDSIDVRVSFVTGTTTAVNAAVSLPNGWTTSVGYAQGNNVVVGRWDRDVATASQLRNGPIVAPNASGSTVVNAAYDDFNAAVSPLTLQQAANIWSSSQFVELYFTVQVDQLIGSGTLNVSQNDIIYYYPTGGTWGTTGTVTTNIGPGGVLGGTSTPGSNQFQWTMAPTYPVPTGATAVLETSPDGIHWSRGANFSLLAPVENLRYDGTNWFGANTEINTSGQIVLCFGKYPYGTTATPYTGTWYLRIAVGLPGQAVGFGIASNGSSGLIPYYQDGTFTATASGACVTSVTAAYTRVGRVVTLTFPAIVTGGSAAAQLQIAGLPSQLYPATAKYFGVPVENSGGAQGTLGGLNIPTSGNLVIGINGPTLGTFANTGNQGLMATSITYTID